jgi:hypothetical protein
MKQIKYVDSHINLNSRGYSYLHLPKPLMEALNSQLVDLVLTDSGILVQPKEEKRRGA